MNTEAETNAQDAAEAYRVWIQKALRMLDDVPVRPVRKRDIVAELPVIPTNLMDDDAAWGLWYDLAEAAHVLRLADGLDGASEIDRERERDARVAFCSYVAGPQRQP